MWTPRKPEMSRPWKYVFVATRIFMNEPWMLASSLNALSNADTPAGPSSVSVSRTKRRLPPLPLPPALSSLSSSLSRFFFRAACAAFALETRANPIFSSAAATAFALISVEVYRYCLPGPLLAFRIASMVLSLSNRIVRPTETASGTPSTRESTLPRSSPGLNRPLGTWDRLMDVRSALIFSMSFSCAAAEAMAM